MTTYNTRLQRIPTPPETWFLLYSAPTNTLCDTARRYSTMEIVSLSNNASSSCGIGPIPGLRNVQA